MLEFEVKKNSNKKNKNYTLCENNHLKTSHQNFNAEPSEFLENNKELFLRYYMHSSIIVICSYL